MDQGYDKLRGGNKPHTVKRQAGLTSVEIRIKHKLIGEEAELRFFESTDTRHPLSCAKGWFCPYLYCSSRVAQLSRMKDFTIAEVLGPGLKGELTLISFPIHYITSLLTQGQLMRRSPLRYYHASITRMPRYAA